MPATVFRCSHALRMARMLPQGRRPIPPLSQRALTSKEGQRSFMLSLDEGKRLLQQVLAALSV